MPNLDQRVGVEEKLEAQIPLDLPLTNHLGKGARLRNYLDKRKPTILIFAYYTCPVLCNLVMESTTRALNKIDWTLGEDFNVVTISIDPKEKPAQAKNKRQSVLSAYTQTKLSDQQWPFLLGNADTITAMTKTAGFRYFYDQAQEQYAHNAVLILLTPDAKIARYLYGIDFAPNDLKLALLEASKREYISTTDKILLYCYRYDGSASKYVLFAESLMKIGGALIAGMLAMLLGWFWWRERRQRPPNQERLAI